MPKSLVWSPRMDERWTDVEAQYWVRVDAQSEATLGERGSPRLGVVWSGVVSQIVGERGLAWMPKSWRRLDWRGLVNARKTATFGRPREGYVAAQIVDADGCPRSLHVGVHDVRPIRVWVGIQ